MVFGEPYASLISFVQKYWRGAVVHVFLMGMLGRQTVWTQCFIGAGSPGSTTVFRLHSAAMARILTRQNPKRQPILFQNQSLQVVSLAKGVYVRMLLGGETIRQPAESLLTSDPLVDPYPSERQRINNWYVLPKPPNRISGRKLSISRGDQDAM